MSDRKKAPPPRKLRSRRGVRSGIPRTIVRRDIFNQTVEALQPPAAPHSQIGVVNADKTAGGTSADAGANFAATVATSTTSAEGVKRPRSEGSSPQSTEEEDKRPRLERPSSFDSSSETATGEAIIESPLSPPGLEQGSHKQQSSQMPTWPRASTSNAGMHFLPEATDLVKPPTPLPGPSYSVAASAPVYPKSKALLPATSNSITATPMISRSGYPPITVECLPNWTRHFEELSRRLGRAPNARPLGKGVRFLPTSSKEFRLVQCYLEEAMKQDQTISWFCDSPASELPVQVAIRGLPSDTPPEKVLEALKELGFPAVSAKGIPPTKGQQGCIFFVQLSHMSLEKFRQLYGMTELLCIPGLIIDAWRGNKVPLQCYHCQSFTHASGDCHRPVRFVRCAGKYLETDCPRRGDVYKRTKEPIKQHPSLQPKARPTQRPRSEDMPIEEVERWERATQFLPTGPETRMPTTLLPQTNPPTARNQPQAAESKKKKKRKKRKAKRSKRSAGSARLEPGAESTPQPKQHMAAAPPFSQVPKPAPTTTFCVRVPSPNTVAALRIFMDALTSILVAYTQGQDIVPAISVGIASLSQLLSS